MTPQARRVPVTSTRCVTTGSSIRSRRRSPSIAGTPTGTPEVLVAEREDVVRAEPFDAIDLRVGVLFGDDDAEA